MIRLSPRGAISYQYLTLTVSLLLCYGVGFMLSAFQQLPAIPLADALDPAAVIRFSERSLTLALLTGLIAAGLAMHEDAPSIRRRIWFQRAWTAWAAASVITCVWVDALLLDAGTSIALLILLAMTRGQSAVVLSVWRIGLLLTCLCLPAAHLVGPPWPRVIALFQLYAAFGLGALSLIFWLSKRVSAVDGAWADEGLRITSGLVFLAGGLISMAPLELPTIVSMAAIPLVMLCYMNMASHSVHILRMPNRDASLAAQWIAVATLFWLIAGAFLGAMSLPANLNRAMSGSALAAAGDWLMAWALLSVLCAFVNARACELRGDNRRVTGYVPLWLVAFGAGLSTIVNGCRGVVEIYLREHYALNTAEILELLQPLTALWILCLLAVFAGLLTYALGYWARLPKIHSILPP